MLLKLRSVSALAGTPMASLLLLLLLSFCHFWSVLANSSTTSWVADSQLKLAYGKCTGIMVTSSTDYRHRLVCPAQVRCSTSAA